jgi:hypothetical protein
MLIATKAFVLAKPALVGCAARAGAGHEHLGLETAAKKVCAEGVALSAGPGHFFQDTFGAG